MRVTPEGVLRATGPAMSVTSWPAARAARAAGHDVTLIAGPVSLKTPPGVTRIDVVSARDMLNAVRTVIARADVLVMTAAVADWRPAHCASRKLKKTEMSDTLHLVRNPDILKTINSLVGSPRRGDRLSARSASGPYKRGLIRIGFAAETGAPAAEAARKCREKGLDLVVGNDVTEPGSGFGTDTNRVTFVTPDGNVQRLPLMSKLAVARRIVSFAERRAKGKE